jgi:hypothetical protein
MAKGPVNLEDGGHMTYDDSNVTYLSKPTGGSGEALRAEEWRVGRYGERQDFKRGFKYFAF